MSRRDFEGKTVLVTGAARGLGKALSERFAAAGARVGGIDVLAGELEALDFASAACDLADEDATRAAVAELRDELGPVDVLVNNAGITHLKSFNAAEPAAVRRVMEVNFFGAVHATAACFDDLVARRGMVIVLSSVAGYAPLVGRTAYCASKHALHGFFETLRSELCGAGVDVLMVCPSYIATGIRERYRVDGARQTVGSEASPEAVASMIVRAAERRRRHLNTGTVGKASYWVRRFWPRLYEVLMLRRVRAEE